MLPDRLNNEEKYISRGLKQETYEKFCLENLLKEDRSLEQCVGLKKKKMNLPACCKDGKYVITESIVLAFMINVRFRKAVNFFDRV
jgi:hypothetical protein